MDLLSFFLSGGYMKIQISRTNLFKTLQKIINIIPTKSTTDIVYNILLISENNILKLIATDLEITQVSWVNCLTETNGSVTIPGKLLMDIVRELPEGNINLYSDERSKIEISSDSGIYKLSGQPVHEFPSVPLIETDKSVNIEGKQLKKMIEKTIFACSTDNLRPSLTGIYCQFFENEYRMVATDGHRLVKYVYQQFSSHQFTGDIIVPTKALNFVARNIAENTSLKLFIEENFVLFELQDTKIFSRIIKEPFPDYERVIPNNYTKEIILDRENFISSVRRVSLFSNPLTAQITLSLNANRMNISAKDIDFGGEANEAISCDFTGENLDIAYNSDYLLDILKHMDSTDILLKVEDPDGPGLVFPKENEEFENITMLIMPVRIHQ